MPLVRAHRIRVTHAAHARIAARDSNGDGATLGDIQDAGFGSDDREFLLRAERRGPGERRVYTITYEARDASGNATVRTAEVTVPHDKSARALLL